MPNFLTTAWRSWTGQPTHTQEEYRERDQAAGLDQTAQIEASRRRDELMRRRQQEAEAEYEANPPDVATMVCSDMFSELNTMFSELNTLSVKMGSADPSRMGRLSNRMGVLGGAIRSRCGAEVALQNFMRAVTNLNTAIASRDQGKIAAAQGALNEAAAKLPRSNKKKIILASVAGVAGLAAFLYFKNKQKNTVGRKKKL